MLSTEKRRKTRGACSTPRGIHDVWRAGCRGLTFMPVSDCEPCLRLLYSAQLAAQARTGDNAQQQQATALREAPSLGSRPDRSPWTVAACSLIVVCLVRTDESEYTRLSAAGCWLLPVPTSLTLPAPASGATRR